MSRQQPEQQAPPVQRLRVRYAKRGRLRFTSHRDVSRAVERAIFRARVPMAYSSGFNPHPRISYAGAAPTGAASEAEYLELALNAEVDPAAIGAALDEALPPGLDVLEVVVSPGGGVADRLEASVWHLDVDLDPEDASRMVADFLAAPEVLVERMTKKGLREFDCRSAVVRLEAAPLTDGLPGGSPWRTRLELLLRHAVPAVRPDDVLTGLAAASGAAVPGGALLTRLRQGPFDEATSSVGDPLG